MRDSCVIPVAVVCLFLFVGPACFDAGQAPSEEDTGSVADVVDSQSADGDRTGSDTVTCREGSVCRGACVNTAVSNENCGGCGNECLPPDGAAHVAAECVEGSCELRCREGYSDEDGDLKNGCEIECKPSNGGTEICDSKDNDCDGETDEEFETGECTVGEGACQVKGTYQCVGAEFVECDATAKMPSDEKCGDGVDNDCDGKTDEGDDATDATTYYHDSDGDGFGDPNDTKKACSKPSDYVANDKDCDDGDGSVKPRDFYADGDGDGYTKSSAVTKCRGSSAPSGFKKSKSSKIDCDDGDKAIYPGAAEVCDGNDTNCDGQVDNIPQNSSEGTVYYVDCDGDGYAASTGNKERACSKPGAPTMVCSTSSPGWTTTKPDSSSDTDCNADAPKAYPGQTQYFDTPTKNSNLGDSNVEEWDYNCDGWVAKRWGSTSCDGGGDASCSCPAGAAVPTGGGYAGSGNISCGASATFYPCECSGTSFVCPCSLTCGSSRSEKQQCR